jgi:hypothetical protein
MAMVICGSCGKENEPTGNWKYCRCCGGRLAAPVVIETVLADAHGDEAVTAITTAARVPVAQAASRRSQALTKPQQKNAQKIQQQMRWWTYGLILGFGLIGMVVGSVMKERGVDYKLFNDPFNVGMVGGFVLGGLIAQIMIWIKQSQQT